MLLVKTILKPVKGKGIGCFAAQYIKKGSILYRDDPEFDRVFTEEQVNNFPEWKQKWFFEYTPFDGKVYYLNVDNARFINHSFKPNIDYIKETGEYKAIKNIKIQEELVSDYRQFDINCENNRFGFEIID